MLLPATVRSTAVSLLFSLFDSSPPWSNTQTHTQMCCVVNNTAGFYRLLKVQLQPLSSQVQSFQSPCVLQAHACMERLTLWMRRTTKHTQTPDIVQEIRSIIAGVFSPAIEGG